jgi:glycosyltransferase involved in cell wall biosynthesis
VKIAIIGVKGYPYVYGGFETFAREVAERLSNKHEIHIYCHKSLFKERPKEVNGIHLHYLPAIEMKSFTQLTHSFLSTVHALFQGYDLMLYVNPANGPFGLLCRLVGLKCILNTDGVEWERPKWKGLGATYFYWASRMGTWFFNRLVSDSDEMARIYKKLFQAESAIIAYGANVKHSKDPSLIQKHGIAAGDYYLIVGRLIPDNNADVIVEGFLASESKRKLVIVGDVPFSDTYATSIKQMASDNIVFTGYVTDQDELMELYANAYCYFHGHEFGGTNPALLKALAYGCCVLALDTPFSREVLLNNEHGFYFFKSPESVAQSIDYADDNEEEVAAFRDRSRRRIESNYTWEKIADQYDKLFAEVHGR